MKSYVEYVIALGQLQERLGADAAELAGWIALGAEDGGITAYTNANELDSPPQFHFDDACTLDYRLAIMDCWFKSDELAGFDPKVRFVTGRALCQRWEERMGGLEAARYQIRVQIRQSRLLDTHPVFGLSRESADDPEFPPLEEALFELSSIERIEDSWEIGGMESAKQAKRPVVGSKQWRTENARRAAIAKHAKTASERREKADQLLSAWESGKYASRDLCAEEEARALGMSFSRARKLLRNTPDPVKPG